MIALTVSEIANWVGGITTGDASVAVVDAVPLQDASQDCITLADHPRQAISLEKSPASAAVVPKGFPECNKALIVVENPHVAFESIVSRFRPVTPKACRGVHPSAIVDETAKIGSGTVVQAGAYIAENVVIGKDCTIYSGVNIMANSRIGDHCTLYPGAILYPGTILEDRVLIHAAAILGAYGFGYRQISGKHERTAQLGWVHLESDVEIGAGTTVDRGTYGATRIGMGTKIDNQCQIGHNVRIGRHNLICAQCGIAGSSSTGDYVVLAGQVGVKDHIHIADRATIGAQSGIMQDVAPGDTMLGSPGMPHKQTMIQVASLARLPELRKQIKLLQQQVDALMETSATSQSKEPRRAA